MHDLGWSAVTLVVAPKRDWVRTADLWLTWTGLHMSLGFKLLAPTLLTTAILVSGLGLMVTNQVRTQIQDAYDEQAQTVAAGVAATYIENPSDTVLLDDYLGRVKRTQHDVTSIRILSLDKTTSVIASDKSVEVGKGGLVDAADMQAIWAGRPVEKEHDGGELEVIRPIKFGDSVLGAVMITSSNAAANAATRSITLTIAAAGLIALIVESTFIFLALYFGIIRRTRRMHRAVEAVSHGDTSIRLSEGQEARGRDEIFNLARGVDHMIANVDQRQRGEKLISSLGQRAMQGVAAPLLIAEALTATRQAMGLEACIFARVTEDGALTSWTDHSSAEKDATSLPVWVYALTDVAIEARRAILTDRFGQQSRFAEAPEVMSAAQAAIVPLPRTSKAGYAIVAIAPVGETIPDGGLAVLDAIAATVAETLHMQAAETARAESAVKSKVMAAVSHELRNPLNSILGFTGLVLGSPLTDKQRRQLGFVQTSATTMLHLINNYLDLAKLRSGSLPIQYENVHLAALVSEVENAMQPIATAMKVTIQTSVSDAEVRLDPTRTRQILTNLVSNAIKFTPPGGRVMVRARADDESCRLVVSDTGVGIPKEQRSLIFTEFAKVDAGLMAASKGTGLGLALTKAFVVGLGGTIKFYSRHGRGTTFVVVLPHDGEEDARGSAA